MAIKQTGLVGNSFRQRLMDATKQVESNPSDPKMMEQVWQLLANSQKMPGSDPAALADAIKQQAEQAQAAKTQTIAMQAAQDPGVPAVAGAPIAGDPLGHEDLGALASQNAQSIMQTVLANNASIDEPSTPSPLAVSDTASAPQGGGFPSGPMPQSAGAPPAAATTTDPYAPPKHTFGDWMKAAFLPQTSAALQRADQFKTNQQIARAQAAENASFNRDSMGTPTDAAAPAQAAAPLPITNSQGADISSAFAPQTAPPKLGQGLLGGSAPTVVSTDKPQSAAQLRRGWDQMSPDELFQDPKFMGHYNSVYGHKMAQDYVDDRVKARGARDKYTNVQGRMVSETDPTKRGPVEMKLPDGARPLYDENGNTVGFRMGDRAAQFYHDQSFATQSGQSEAQANNTVKEVKGPNGVTLTGPESTFTQGGKGAVIVGQDPSVVDANNKEIVGRQDKINTAKNNMAKIDKWSNEMDKGRLTFGPMTNLAAGVRNATGHSTLNSRNQELAKSDFMTMVNDTMNAANGVQARDDAIRVRETFIAHWDDPKIVRAQMERLRQIQQTIIDQNAEIANSRQAPSASGTSGSAATGPSARAQAIEAAIARKRAQLGH